MAVRNFQCTYGRSKVVLCPPGLKYVPYYWFTRYPQQTIRLWNLVGLFTPASWMWTFLTIFSVVVFLKLFCFVGRKLGLATKSDLTENSSYM